MASSVQVSIPLEFFHSVIGRLLSNENLGIYVRLYAEAVNSRTECLTQEAIDVVVPHKQLPTTIDALAGMGLLEKQDNGVKVVGCSENHKRLDFGGVKKKARESTPIEVPGPLLDLDQLNTNADLCGRFSELMKSWKQTYPLVNVLKELIKANNWLTNNPKVKRPNKSRFLAHWFGKAQGYAERRGATGGAGAGSSVSAWEGR